MDSTLFKGEFHPRKREISWKLPLLNKVGSGPSKSDQAKSKERREAEKQTKLRNKKNRTITFFSLEIDQLVLLKDFLHILPDGFFHSIGIYLFDFSLFVVMVDDRHGRLEIGLKSLSDTGNIVIRPSGGFSSL